MLPPSFLRLPEPGPYLLPEEREVLRVRRHAFVLLKPLAQTLLIWLAALLLMFLGTGQSGPLRMITVLLLVAGVLRSVFAWFRWHRTVLVITNRRVFEYTAMGLRRVTVRPVLRQAILYRQTPLGRAFGFGTVIVMTPGGGELFKFEPLADPERFRDEITSLAT